MSKKLFVRRNLRAWEDVRFGWVVTEVATYETHGFIFVTRSEETRTYAQDGRLWRDIETGKLTDFVLRDRLTEAVDAAKWLKKTSGPIDR